MKAVKKNRSPSSGIHVCLLVFSFCFVVKCFRRLRKRWVWFKFIYRSVFIIESNMNLNSIFFIWKFIRCEEIIRHPNCLRRNLDIHFHYRCHFSANHHPRGRRPFLIHVMKLFSVNPGFYFSASNLGLYNYECVGNRMSTMTVSSFCVFIRILSFVSFAKRFRGDERGEEPWAYWRTKRTACEIWTNKIWYSQRQVS